MTQDEIQKCGEKLKKFNLFKKDLCEQIGITWLSENKIDEEELFEFYLKIDKLELNKEECLIINNNLISSLKGFCLASKLSKNQLSRIA